MAERSIELDSIELAAAIFGSGDRNIQQVRAVISRWDFLTKMSFVETLLL